MYYAAFSVYALGLQNIIHINRNPGNTDSVASTLCAVLYYGSLFADSLTPFLSSFNLMSRSRSWLRNPVFGQISL